MSLDAKSRADIRMPHLFLQSRDRRILVDEFGCEPVTKNMESSKLHWYSKFLEHGFQTVPDDVISTPRLRALQVRKEQPPRIYPAISSSNNSGAWLPAAKNMGSEAVDVSVLVRPMLRLLSSALLLTVMLRLAGV